MGLIVKNANNEIGNDDLKVGDHIKVISTNMKGTIVFVISSLFQIELEDGSVRSYRKDEIKRI